MPHEHSFLKIVRPEDVPVSIIAGVYDNEPEEGRQENERPCRGLPAFFADNLFWKNFTGDADQWRDHATQWIHQLSGCMTKSEPKVEVLMIPDYTIKANPGELIQLPLTLKKVG